VSVPATDAEGARVLAFADVASSYVAAWRIHGPLEAMRRQGLIADFAVTDAGLRGIPRGKSFDVIWLQRGVEPGLTRLLADRFQGEFLLDIDDHLLCRPDYLGEHEFPPPGPVVDALRSCRVLTTTSPRLRRLLEDRSGVRLSPKAVVCPNSTELASVPIREPRPPDTVLLTQGQRLALVESAVEVLGAVGDFCARHALPLFYFGPPVPRLSPLAEGLLRNVVTAGEMRLAAYHEVLAWLPAMLAIAPLETAGDAQTVEFVAGKSDVKMVEYGGHGHFGVYSDAPPYADSDLQCGCLAENTYEAWSAALEQGLAEGWRRSAAEQAGVVSRRDVDSVARSCWYPAVQAARLERTVAGRDVARALDRIRATWSGARARLAWHLG
jgi:hypothetical protein